MKMQNPGQSWARTTSMTMGSMIERERGKAVKLPHFILQLGQGKHIHRISQSPWADRRQLLEILPLMAQLM